MSRRTSLQAKASMAGVLDFGALPLADQRVTRSVEDQGLDRHAAPVSLVLSSLPADAWRQLEKAAGGEVTTDA